MTRKRLTFDGFMLEMGEVGEKDSEGVFTLAGKQTVERLREQYVSDPILGFTEILQGFQQLGAERVEISNRSVRDISISALFPGEAPNLSEWLDNPLSILAAQNGLHSGSGLVLLQHEEDEVVWSSGDHREGVDFLYSQREGRFRKSEVSRPVTPFLQKIGAGWLRFRVTSHRPLDVYCKDSVNSWGRSALSREFTNRLAFYGRPLLYRRRNLQCPLPGRLVPTDHWSRSPLGGTGHNWVPMAFQYTAAQPNSKHYFLSEPFTGVIAEKVDLDGVIYRGYRSRTKPCYVSFRGCEGSGTVSSVPFKRHWWRGPEKLHVPGFEAFPQILDNPRLEPPLLRSHPSGRSLVCSRILMLSTASSGLSTLVFLKHGVVLGARHEDLGAPGSLCLVGVEGLSTDLSRRRIRQDENYHNLLGTVREEMKRFHNEAAHVLGF